MYVSTFYSFKGGVGRTMALVNVAVELAQKGQRVVAVDFDLEAPGLDTFDLGRPAETTPGLIDFVETFLATDQAPDVREFLFESPPLGEKGGRLWVMPSGVQDANYAQRLAELDWGQLYEQHDGYLLFEDLKEQWRQQVDADYVLIDSRTGYTDVGGICTRQLPDAVVLLFFPNQQNLRGLTKIVRDIRAEASGPQNKAIDLHYVLSNVPDIDDEDEILQDITSDFRKQLGFNREPLSIHRYPSLSLLKQDIFTRNRPRSRLAREYRSLASEIIRLNPADRAGALEYISRYERRQHGRRLPRSDDRDERQLNQIERRQANDGQVLFRLGRLRASQGKVDNSASLFDRAIETGYGEPQAYLERAKLRRWQMDDPVGASQDALAVLQASEVTFPEVSLALRLLAPGDLAQVPTSPAIRELPAFERLMIATDLTRSKSEAELARSLLEPLTATDDLEPEDLARARQGAILALLALGRFSQAAAICRASSQSIETMSVQHAFNFGMALWGEQGEPSRGPFARVVELDALESKPPENANYAQCLALANWALGDLDAATNAVAEAESRIRIERASFSCWRYLTVPSPIFARDLHEMNLMINGNKTVAPRFMRQPRNGEEASSPTDAKTPEAAT